ncbi:MAG: AAA family ATPase [Pseudomonadota bacterium]
MSLTSPDIIAIISEESDRQFVDSVVGVQEIDAFKVIVSAPSEAAKVIEKNGYSPYYILIDIGLHSYDMLAEIDALSSVCNPSTRVVVLGSINDIKFYRELKLRGVLEYFAKPINPEDVKTALFSGQVITSRKNGTVISFMGAASADGASTLAINTAYSLARDYNKSVVLVDMDYQFGMIAKNLGLTGKFGIKELFDNPERGIDSTLIERIIVPYKNSNLKIISAPNQLYLYPEVNAKIVANLISTLKRNYDFVVLDLPHNWNNFTISAISNSNHVIIVAQLWLRSITHSARLIPALRQAGVVNEGIHLVANRSGAKFKEAVNPSDFEKVCGLPFEYYFLNDTKNVVSAENNGRTILEEEGSKLAREFKEFASNFVQAEIEMQKQEEIPVKSSGFFSSFAKK